MIARHPELVRLDLPARYAYLHLLSECIAEMLRLIENINDFETVCYNIQLAAHEICTNIINHAYDKDEQGRLEICLTLTFAPTPCLTIDLFDRGQPFDPEKYNAPNLEEVQVHGYGLFLVRHLMDSVVYTPAKGRNHWSLSKNLFIEGM